MDFTSHHDATSHADTSHVDAAIHHTVMHHDDTSSHHNSHTHNHHDHHGHHGHRGHHGHHGRDDIDPPPPYEPRPGIDPAYAPLVHNASYTVYYDTFHPPTPRRTEEQHSWNPQLCLGLWVWIISLLLLVWFACSQIMDVDKSPNGWPGGSYVR